MGINLEDLPIFQSQTLELMEKITVGDYKTEYWCPESIDDVKSLVDQAIKTKKVICVRGSAHSFPLIDTLESTQSGNIYLLLSKMRTVTIDKAKGLVTVEAGCHLGGDPYEPIFPFDTRKPQDTSQDPKSLLYQLDQAGLAVADLGGITHQSVGGFLSTGSSGGSLQWSLEDALVAVDVVTSEGGQATLKHFERPANNDPNDPFFAVGLASIGLFGVIVQATFKCVPKFWVAGSETTTDYAHCEIDLFGDGSSGKQDLKTWLYDKKNKNDYTRLMWWPQRDLEAMVVWKAWQVATKAEADAWSTSTYQEVPRVFKSPEFLAWCADKWFELTGDLKLDKHYKLYAGMMKLAFVKLNDVQKFADTWYDGIPMDNQMDDKLMPVWFTELWIDINQVAAVMNALKTYYAGGYEQTGFFSCEIYATKASQFWLSPAYQTDVIRIDVFWFARKKDHTDKTDIMNFYQNFWNLLAPFAYRPHWGKFLPDQVTVDQGNGQHKTITGVDYLKGLYPKWNDWMALRDQLDPSGVFLNEYWNAHLGISK